MNLDSYAVISKLLVMLNQEHTPGDHRELSERLAQWLNGPLPDPFDVSAWCGKSLRDQWNQLFKFIQ